MSRWWDTNMQEAGQALYGSPDLALDAAAVPQHLTSDQINAQQKAYADAMDKQGGFMATLAGAVGKTDSWLSNIPGWGVAKEAIGYPIDKVASGFRFAYSNVVSQPISTLLLHASRADLGTASMFSDWGQDWKAAEHISPGQAFMNYENTAEATDQGTMMSGFFGDAGQTISPHEKAMVKQNVDRFIYDTDYWKNKSDWKYNVGSGSLDFFFNMTDPVVGAAGSVAKGIKGARSVEVTSNKAYKMSEVVTRPKRDISIGGKTLVEGYEGRALQATDEGQASVVRTRGPIADIFAKPQTAEDVVGLKSMQGMFDWMKADGRTVEEIANHPVWGRGRRVNPARYDIARIAKDTPRDSMEQLWRFTLGDSDAGAELAAKAPEVLKKVGQLMDDRVLLEGTKVDIPMVSFFKANYEFNMGVPGATKPIPYQGLKVRPPTPRPATPGPSQDAWDASWGAMVQKANIHRTMAANIAEKTPVHMRPAIQQTLLADGLKAQAWKDGHLQTMADDYDELLNNEKYLGGVLGQMDNWTPAASPLFGAINKNYRMGVLGLRNTETAAERATVKSAGKKAKAVGSNFVMTTVKRGMGVPVSIIHNFGDKVPQGFVDHNADDARDRVFDMLKQVKGMTPESRLGLIEIYNGAGNKIERSQALDKIHDAVMNHILVNTHNLHPDVADVLKGAIKHGIDNKLMELTGKSGPAAKRFGPEATAPDDIAKLSGQPSGSAVTDLTPVRSDRVVTQEDGTAIAISPLAKTQLSSNDILFPVQEINRLVAQNGNALRAFRHGNAANWVMDKMDGFDNLWKAATLLRPGFIPRMVSDEVLARAFKFGGMATLLDMSKGLPHFLENRARQVGAIMGKGSYVPTTGKGMASSHAIIALDNPGIIAKAEARGMKTTRIQVPATLNMAYRRISDEGDSLLKEQRKLARAIKNPKSSPAHIAATRDMIQSHKDAIDEFHDYVGEILRKAEVSKGRRLGDRDFKYTLAGQTYRVPQAFSDEWENPIPRDQISSENAWKSLFTRGQMLDRQRFWSYAEKTGAFKLVTPDDPGHMESWLDALNKQIRQDPFHRMIAGGATDKEALRWLRDNQEGRQYMASMGYWNRNKPQFVNNVRFMIDKYLGDDFLKAKLAKGEVISEAELRSAFTRDDFPIVHGEEIKEHSGINAHETARNWLDDKMETAWKQVADVPADILSRHPTFLQLHQNEMERLITQQYQYRMQKFGDDAITPKEWEQMNQKAATRAKSQMRQLVYDPVNTVGSQGLRFVYPFFKPFLDGADRWSGLVAERPAQLGKLAKIYDAPVAANLVTDTDGHHVDENGMASVRTYDRNTGTWKVEKTFVPLAERVLHVKAPWAKASAGDKFSIRMASLNTILPGDPWFDPGSGPIVQLAGNQLAKSSPQVGDFLQWAKILPYGPSDDSIDLLTPKYMSDAYHAFMGEDTDNVKYQQAVLDIYNLKTAQYYDQMRQGKHAEPPKMSDIQKGAKHFLWLQALTSWMSPVSVKNTPLTGTKYQYFVDQAKALQSTGDPQWRDRFLSQFGEDYIGFTADLTKSMGISASQSAEKQLQKYKDLITEDPSMAPLVAGNVYNGGPFSSSIYLKQLHEEVGGVKVRERVTAQEAINEVRTQEGWRQYMASTKALNAELIRAGFTSYAQTGAEVFQQAKQNLVANISEQNPGWAHAFSTTDRNAVPNRIGFMQKMVQDPTLMNDPMRSDVHTLAEYLQVRDAMKQQLAQRGLQQLSFDESGAPAGQAPDIGAAWRQYQMYFQNKSLNFETLFNRYLANDDLQ